MRRVKKSQLAGDPSSSRYGKRGLTKPVFSAKGVVLFPGSELPVSPLLVKPVVGDHIILVCDEMMPQSESDAPYWVGTEAVVNRLLKLPGGGFGALVSGIHRVLVREVKSRGGKKVAVYDEVLDERFRMTDAIRVAMRRVKTALHNLARNSPGISHETLTSLEAADDPATLCDGVAALLSLGLREKYDLLATFGVRNRMKRVAEGCRREADLLRLSNKIHDQVEGDLQEHVRRNYLQEQLRAIKRELGELDGSTGEIEEWESRLEELELGESIQSAVEKELDRMAMMAPGSPEYMVSHTFLSWVYDLPWGRHEEPPLPSLQSAKRQLGKEHYGLGKVKERILDYLAVMHQHGGQKGQILLLVGPPGVGKTSLAQSIAKALKRQFVRVSLGGVKDEAEIRGHRRTYVGSMPGKILQAVKQAGTKGPVILLDEIDKVGMEQGRKEIEAALLEVLDPGQNHKFTDHFMGLPYDLSNVIFLATANTAETISEPLLDRMETLEIPSYTEKEKMVIADRYLIPAVRKDLHLPESAIRLSERLMRKIIREYTHEAGVRQLKREILGLGRKVVRAKVEGKGTLKITGANIEKMLGPPRYLEEPRDKNLPPGVSVGLAYTELGGEILYIEASRTNLPSSVHRLTLTGNLGKVMRESAQAAVSYLVNLQLSDEEQRERVRQIREIAVSQIHVHVPDGGTPKDGPSAGVAILCAIASLFLQKSLPSGVAMTGEITLRGQVLAVGGIREKLLAAHRYGKKTVLMPRANERDLVDLPKEARRDLDVVFVDTMDQVLAQVGLLE